MKTTFFGLNGKDLNSKKYDIFIGVSINKKLTFAMAKDYLEWALKNTNNKVAVVIADELNIINYQIYDKYSLGKSINRARKVGDSFEHLFNRVIAEFSPQDQKKINIYRWNDIKNSFGYLKIKKLLSEEYESNPKFASLILHFVKKYRDRKGKLTKDTSKLGELSEYLLGELPTLLQGIYLEGIYYGLCLYSTYSSSGMSDFVMKIHDGELQVSKQLKSALRRKAVLVESWLD